MRDEGQSKTARDATYLLHNLEQALEALRKGRKLAAAAKGHGGQEENIGT